MMIIFGSSLPPVVGRRAHVLFMLFVWFYFFIICIKQKSDRVSQSVYKYNNDMIPDSFRISGLSKSYSQYGVLHGRSVRVHYRHNSMEDLYVVLVNMI
jgi:hypothetical protein